MGVLIVALPVLLNGCAVPRGHHSPIKTDPTYSEPGGSTPAARRERTAPPHSPSVKAITAAHTNIWLRLASEFAWPHTANVEVQAEIRVLSKRPHDFAQAAYRAKPYLWFIAELLASRNLPAELALIPLIESGFRPRAESPRGASGLWQFMPTTGRRFKLKQTRWYDARLDVIASTSAALDYLEQLHRRFAGNWLLALAAYNCGPATVQRIAQNVSAQRYWEIADELPAETRLYVSRLLATIEIIRRPKRYGVDLQPISNAQYFTEIDLGGPLDLNLLMTIDGWSEDGFKQLNAAFKRRYTDPQGSYRILAPVALRDRIVGVIDALSDDQRIPIRIHIVSAGDTLAAIAMRYDVGINTIKRRNQIRGNLIRIGAELIVHGPMILVDGNNAGRSGAGDHPHVVQPGDSFWTLGQKYGTSGKSIADLNNLSLGTTLSLGQVLVIHRPPDSTRYDVAPGDSLWTIARKFKVTVVQLTHWNELPMRRPLQLGQSLIVSNPRGDKSQKI